MLGEGSRPPSRWPPLHRRGIQVVVTKDETNCEWSKVLPERALQLTGALIPTSSGTSSGRVELHASHVLVVSHATKAKTFSTRSPDTSILSPNNAHLVSPLDDPCLAQLDVFRSHKSYISYAVSTPIITPTIFYEPSPAVHLANLSGNSKPLFLSQCAGLYLEAYTQAHKRVYNLGLSSRNESRSNRHLMGYWHIKAELCSGALDDIILVEVFPYRE